MTSQMKMCNRPTCRCRTRHKDGWHDVPGFFGRVHGFACGNCGMTAIGRNMLVAPPDEVSRWATNDEIRAMRKAQQTNH